MSCPELMQRAFRFLCEPIVHIMPCSVAKEMDIISWKAVEKSNLEGTWIDKEGMPLVKRWESGTYAYTRGESEEQYLVVEKRERYFSLVERIIRGSIGTFFILISLGKLLALKGCRALLFAEKEVALIVTKQSDALDSRRRLLAIDNDDNGIDSVDFSSHPRITVVPRVGHGALKCLKVQRTMVPKPLMVKEVELPHPKPKLLVSYKSL